MFNCVLPEAEQSCRNCKQSGVEDAEQKYMEIDICALTKNYLCGSQAD